MDQPTFPDYFDEILEVAGVMGNRAHFGLDILSGLVEGISDFSDIRQERWPVGRSRAGPGDDRIGDMD